MNSRLYASSRQSRQQGSSLLEVLVTMVVLAFGLLGMAGLQAASLKVNQSAMQRSQATVLAHDMFERIRLGASAGVVTGTPYDIDLGDPDPAGAGIAETDIRLWRLALQAALGNGARGAICRSSAAGVCDAGGDFHRIDIEWADATHAVDVATGTAAIERTVQSVVVVGRP